MAERETPSSVPPPEAVDDVFSVYETRRDGDRIIYFGELLAPREAVIRSVWPRFRERGYEVTLTRRTGEDVLVAEPIDTSIDGIPWTNVVLFVVTVLSTLYVGTTWYYIRWNPAENPLAILGGWPFAAAVLGILGVHEFGHYALSRHHDVDASLPYFIPWPFLIGTMGAFIRMRGQMPNRRALFDIGVAGPLAGLVATVVVTAIGLSMPAIEAPAWVVSSPNAVEFEFGKPLLLHVIAAVLGVAPEFRNPVVIGGWIGMFVTFLNLLPVGQLDGGHIVRAVLGERQRTVAALVPGLLFGLAGYLYYVERAGNAVGIWILWGIITLVVARAGPANPMYEGSLGPTRKAVGALALLLGLLCFTPVPVQILP